MNTFAQAVNAPSFTTTTNGMMAFDKSGDTLTDLFFNIGASRNAPGAILNTFARAFGADKTLAARILFWARDVRGGAGERQVFRIIMQRLEVTDLESCLKLIPFIPEYGRWDDLLVFTTPEAKRAAFQVIALGLRSGDGLCAKWMPRKGVQAAELRNFMGLSPKTYRKLLVGMTNVVEQKMCSGRWDEIDFGKLPSVASKAYMTSFHKHVPEKYEEYKSALVKGDAKINASAIFPHDVLVGMKRGDATVGAAQWEALPNYLGEGDNFILPMVDVSGSMTCPAGGSGNTTCLDVAVALGLYLADKQKGAFAGMFMNFSSRPEIIQLTGDIRQKIEQISRSDWEMSTNVEAAFKSILQLAQRNSVPQAEMPKYLLIFSDMQFNQCSNWSLTTMEMVRAMYRAAGYEMPQIVFWNLNGAYGTSPVTVNETGVALVSGFSPSLMTSILGAKQLSPITIMLSTINSERYADINL